MIELTGVSYSAGKFLLRDVSLTVDRGETLVILGPTGAGKTVLLELIAGFRDPKKGMIRIDGKDITHLAPDRRNIGIVYQDYLLFPHLNVFDNIGYGLRTSRLNKAARDAKVKEIAKQLGIMHLLERKTKKLSGGEQQRVALARTLIKRPDILLLDEPFSAVDPNTKEKLMRELGSILDAHKMPVIYVTHDQLEAAEMADNIAVMNDGKIIQIDSPEKVFSAPKSEFVAGFVGTKNIFKGIATRVDGTTMVEISGVKTYSSIDLQGHVHVTIRPEDIITSKEKLISSARNSLRCKIIGIVEKGGVVLVTGDCGIELTAAITRESFKELKISLDDDIYMTFKASNVNLF